MPWHDSKLYSILHFKCLFCHQGDFFVAHPYNPKRVGDIHERCSVCKRKYSIDPGFYYGAMYVSYGLGVGIAMSIWVAFLLLAPDTALHWQVGTIGAVMLLAGPYLYALSKIIWANMFFDYQGPPATPEQPVSPREE